MTSPGPNGQTKWLAETELGRRLLAEETAKSLTERQALAEQIERIETEAAAHRPGLVERFDQAGDRVAELETELQAAQGERFRAKNAIWDHDHQLGQALIPLRKQLANTAPAAIDRFVGEMEGLVKSAQGERVKTTKTRKGRDFFGRLIATRFRSTLASQSRTVVAARAAQSEAEALKLKALDEAALTESLVTLRATVPTQIEIAKVSMNVRSVEEL